MTPDNPAGDVDLTLAADDLSPPAPPPTPRRTRPGQAFALGGAAAIAAVAGLMAVWLWSQAPGLDTDEAATVTVSYEPLVEPARADGPPTVTAVRRARSRAEPTRFAAGAPVVRERLGPGSTGLEVITEPVGARVTVNGVGWGSTPLALTNLTSGTKRIRVSLPGYESTERVVGADTNRTRVTLRIVLHPLPAGVRPSP